MQDELQSRLPEETHDNELFVESILAIQDIVGEDLQYVVTVTDDFDFTVNEVLGEDGGRYQQIRGVTMTVAKTFTDLDGPPQIILWSKLFERDSPPEQALGTSVHEAFHLAVFGREECLSSIGERRGMRRGSAERTLLALAGIGIEESRVERATVARIPERGVDAEAVFAEVVAIFEDVVTQASLDYQLDLNVEKIMAAVIGAVEGLISHSVYFAARSSNPDAIADAANADSVRSRLLGEPWKRLLTALTAIPDAGTRVARLELDAAADAAKPLLVAWIEHLGFTWTDEDDEAMYFGVNNPDVWLADI